MATTSVLQGGCLKGPCAEGNPQEVGESPDKAPEALVWTLPRGLPKLLVPTGTLAASLGPCKCLPRTPGPQEGRRPHSLE